MSRFGISVSILCVLSVLTISACEQSEAPRKTPPSVERTIAGTWFEGEWINTKVKSATPPELRISAATLMRGSCTFPLLSLVSKDEQKAFLVAKKGSECPSENQKPSTDIILERKGDCVLSVEFYASAEDLKLGAVQASASYTKSGCTPPGAY